MLADLLFEKGNYYSSCELKQESANCYKKSLTLYTFLKAYATLNYSMDMHYKLEILQNMEL